MTLHRFLSFVKAIRLRATGKNPPRDLLVSCSKYFDQDWYLNEYPDVARSGIHPAKHYAVYGETEDRMPGPLFSKFWYSAITGRTDSNVAGLIEFQADTLAKRRAKNLLVEKIVERKSVERIVYESHSLNYQGAPQSLTEIMQGVDATGEYEVLLSCATFGPLAEFAYSNGIPVRVHGITQQQVHNEELWEKNITKLSSWYHEVCADVVHVNTITAFHCVLAASSAGIPVVWNIRESIDPEEYARQLSEFLGRKLKMAIESANTLVFVAEASKKLWEGACAREQRVIRNSLNLPGASSNSRSSLRQELGIDADSFVLLSVGTVCERKGQADLLLMAENLLLECVLPAKLDIVFVGANSGEYSLRLMKAAQSLHERSSGLRITFVKESCSLQQKNELYLWYEIADAFVLNSRSESYPRVVLEAMSFALPVVAAPTFGVLEQVSHAGKKLLYNVGDFKQLSRIVLRLMSDPDFRNEMSKDSRKRFEEINGYGEMIRDYIACYRRLLDF